MDVNLAWDELYPVILSVCDEFYPLKTFYIKKKRSPWYNDDLAELAANRDDFYRKEKQLKDATLLGLVREYHNRAKTATSSARSD